MRIAVGVEYDGCHFHGWQAQPGLRTVQGCLEKALSKVAAKDIVVSCAGRTDTGVHAINQVVHFDVNVERPTRAWIYGVNTQLPKDICVRWANQVNENFHARYSATARRYCYIIYNQPVRPAILRANVTWHYRELNVQLMHQAAQVLLGEHDFSSFRSSECQSKTPFRFISEINVCRRGHYIIIDISANAFLHHMVRNIVGVLMQVGTERQPIEWVESLLAAKNRAKGGETAPPYGLYLLDVTYPESYEIPILEKSQLLAALCI